MHLQLTNIEPSNALSSLPLRLCAAMAFKSVAVINVGGPSTSNFRALGVLPSPLFLIGGRPIIDAPLRAAAQLPGLCAIYVVGFYDQREFATYLNGLASEFGIPVRYLHELSGHGSAGGLHQFRALILEKKPEHIFVLNCDVCCTWPLAGAAPASPAPRAHARLRSAGGAREAAGRDGHAAGHARAGQEGERVRAGGGARGDGRASPLHGAAADVRPYARRAARL